MIKNIITNKKKIAWEIWKYDEDKIDLIKKNGYIIEVVWETDLKNNNKLLIELLSNYAKNKFSTPKWS